MILNGPFTLRLTGSTELYAEAPLDKNALWYLLDRLFKGQEIAEQELRYYGLEIEDLER